MINNKIIFFMPHMVGGGVEKNLYIIANNFAKKIKHVHFITSKKTFNSNFKNVKIINPKLSIWSHFGVRFNYIVCLLILIREILNKKKPLVFAFQANVYCIILCKILNVKIITRSNSSPSGWTQNNLKNYIFNKAFKKADKIIVNSLEFKKQFKKRFNVETECIYNPLNKKEILKKSKNKINLNFFKDNKKLKILNIGRFTDQKDHLTLLKSMKILKDKYKLNFILLIMGRGQNKSIIQNFIKKNNLNFNVKVIGFKKNPYKYIRCCDLFVLSSKFEGLPNVLLEAITLKKFVISSNCPTGPNEILNNGKGGILFKTGNSDDLAKKINFYYNNKKDLKKKIDFAYNNLDRFDFNTNLKKYFETITNFF
ncbi:glycosyltransferase [Candidatus Pelagibacter sp.]|jgi:glycosyltransferase involved in cell wall biosynthesis|nr:glycosyltransferase [Candidatus Pelagibacter sp.]